MRQTLFAFAALALLAGCSNAAPGAPPPSGPVGSMIEDVTAKSDVPRDLVVAIAAVEGGLELAAIRDVDDDDLVPVAGVLELRHGKFDSLRRGAALTGTSERALRRDRALGTEAGVLVLADLAATSGIDRDDLSAWAPIVEQLSGHLSLEERVDYRARVFSLLFRGGAIAARDGERVLLPAHDEIPIGLTFAPPLKTAQDTPEYAGATWYQTPSTDKWETGRSGYSILSIAIHDTEGGWDASVATLQNDPGKSVHYIVDQDGSRVGQFVHEADTAYHVGNGYYNATMVGIEHVGYAADDAYQTPMYVKSADLVNDVAKRNSLGPNGDGTGLDRSVLIGHQEVPNQNLIAADAPPCPDSPASCDQNDDYGGVNNHRDPGIYWNWCQYTDIIRNGAQCKCNDAYTHYNCSLDGSLRIKCDDGQSAQIDPCPYGCTVQAIGVDDTCDPPPPDATATAVSSSSGSATTGAGGASGSGSGGNTTATNDASTTSAATTGAGGSSSSGKTPMPPADFDVTDNSSGCGCRVEASNERPLEGLAPLALVAALALARRRRRG